MLLWGGCRKEAPNERPSVVIVSPSEFSSVTVPDTLLVEVSATDDRGLEQVSVTLLDQHNIPVVPTVHAAAEGTSATLTLALPVVSEQLYSGLYKLFATASDGSLTGKDFMSIHLTAAPLRLRAVFTLATSAAGTTQLYRTDSTGHTALAASYGFELGGAAVGSSAQRLVVAGGPSGDLFAMEPDGLSSVWTLPNQGPIGAPWFTSVDLCSDGLLYVGQDDGTIRAMGMLNGTGGMVAALPEWYRTQQAITTDELLITTQRHFIQGNHRLGINFRSSGVQASHQPLDLAPVGLFLRDGDHALIFGNRNGQGLVLDRTLSGGGSWEAYSWPSPITAVASVGGPAWLVGLANGDLQRFTYGGAGSLGLGNTPALSAMAYDPLNGWVYAGAGSQVLAVDPNNGQVQSLWTVDGAVLRVLPLYNRDPG